MTLQNERVQMQAMQQEMVGQLRRLRKEIHEAREEEQSSSQALVQMQDRHRKLQEEVLHSRKELGKWEGATGVIHPWGSTMDVHIRSYPSSCPERLRIHEKYRAQIDQEREEMQAIWEENEAKLRKKMEQLSDRLREEINQRQLLEEVRCGTPNIPHDSPQRQQRTDCIATFLSKHNSSQAVCAHLVNSQAAGEEEEEEEEVPALANTRAQLKAGDAMAMQETGERLDKLMSALQGMASPCPCGSRIPQNKATFPTLERGVYPLSLPAAHNSSIQNLGHLLQESGKHRQKQKKVQQNLLTQQRQHEDKQHLKVEWPHCVLQSTNWHSRAHWTVS